MNVTFRDFCPVNDWKLDVHGEKFSCPCHYGQPMFVINQTTNRRYLNQPKKTLRTKCFLLTLGTPIVHLVAAVINIVYRLLKLITFAHFWMEKAGEFKYNFKARLVDACEDLLRIIAAPVVLILLELSAFFGLFRHYDGQNLYATLERAEYGNAILAPCFQPWDTVSQPQHLFSGNVKDAEAY